MTTYGGQSLAYVRTLIGAPAKWSSAAAAADVLPLEPGEPSIGALVFYGSQPHGHVGLYLGDYLVLTVSRDGCPTILDIDDPYEWGGPRRGWVPAVTFHRISAA